MTTVARIIATKGRDVVTIPPHRTVGEAARLLAHMRIGAVVVAGADGSVVLGIISERDVVRVIADRGAEGLNDPVSKHMTANVVFCHERTTITELMETMTAKKFRHLPVIERERLAGIVSIGDVVKHRLAEIEAETTAMREYIASA